ncbi:MAG: type II secretion system GspH family protein [Muribaculaceae bacterium]|nr:type II secretion system GspH family protein [Muribaculaceae bacterium]
MKRLKFLGFTLAEILITLGIIGVVAALTIPSLATRIEEKVLINKLLEVNSQLTQASKMMVEEQGLVSTYSDNDVERRDLFFQALSRYLKLSKCTWRSCLTQSYNGAYDKLSNWRFYNDSFYLPNGALVFYTATFNGPCDASLENSSTGYCGFFFVDVNGARKPNTFGIDTFKFQVYPDGIAPCGAPKYNYWANSFSECLKAGAGDYRQSGCCTGWVIKNKNMDYRRCKDLSWTGKTRCSK